MLAFFRKQIGVVLFVSAIVLPLAAPHRTFGQPAANTKREQIGEIFGKAVFRDEINTGRNSRLQDEVFRLFLHPVTQRYYAAHKAEIEPTQAEIDMVAAFFQKNGFDGDDPEEPTEVQLRLQLKEVETQLVAEKLSERRRDHLELKKQWIKRKLDDLPTRGEKIIASIQNLLSTLESIVLAIEMWAIDKKLATPNLTKDERVELWVRLEGIAEHISKKKLFELERDHVKLENERIGQWLDGLPKDVEKYISAIQNLLSALNKNFDKIVFVVRKRRIDWLMAEPNLTKEERDSLKDLKKFIEIEIDPDRTFAVFVLAKWKFERHLYDEFGGGRVLWQQMGLQAFDANRRWFEAEEKNGNFKITDPKLRDAFYRYWTQSHDPYMIEDEATIRKEFLEPEWAPRRAK